MTAFEPADSGRSLLVTRTIYDEDLRQPVTARSAYRRTSDQPRWNFESGNGTYYPASSPRGALAVPDGTRFVTRLDNDLRTSDARQGDRWTMTTVSPSPYAGVGAGTVIVQGRDRFDLQRGTELTFTSGDPRYQR